MTRKLITLAVTGALAGAAAVVPQAAIAQGADIQALKNQLAALQAKLEQLETAQMQATRVVEDTSAAAEKTADILARRQAALDFTGDLRYRNESFDVQYVDRNRDRDRIRARLNVNYRVNDTITGQLAVTTGSSDPRSGNQTLDAQNSRKDFDLDLAYVTWMPNATWRLTAGKQKYPWQRTASYFFDNDVNPEGLSANFTAGNFFAGAFYDWLAERALSFGSPTGTNTDSVLFGAQVGFKVPISDTVKLTLAGTYFDFDGVQGYNPLFGGSSSGNTTTTSAAVCSRTLAPGTACLLSDYDVVEVFADLTTSVGGRPMRLFVDGAKNTAAEVNPVAGEKLDTAYSAGISYGAAGAARGTWELGLIWQKTEKDALFGQLLDSDFGDGNTDTRGFVLRAGYSIARNWTLNATLFVNQLSHDVPQAVTVFDETTPAPFDTTAITVDDRDYKRLQLDLNFRF